MIELHIYEYSLNLMNNKSWILNPEINYSVNQLYCGSSKNGILTSSVQTRHQVCLQAEPIDFLSWWYGINRINSALI